jgi:hypothetical protein
VFLPQCQCHTHTKPQAKLEFYIFQFLCFQSGDENTNSSVLNGSKHYLDSIWY